MSALGAIGDGIELRPLQESDAAELFAIVNRNRDRLGRWLFWVHDTHTAGDVRTFIRQAIIQHAARHGLHCAIRVDGALAGGIGCRVVESRNRSASIGYWLDAAYEGRGIVTRSCRAMLDHAFGDMGMHRVEIRCATHNERSCAIPARLGFTREGILREAEWVHNSYHDLVIWSMLAREWARSGS
jgi:ribosomal-protein-serine acetyltransferase